MEDNNFKKFATPFNGVLKWKAQDCSNKFQKRYIELVAFAKNQDGVIINNNSYSILKEVAPFNIDEYIQSFKEETNIYNILRKVIQLNDPSLLNQKQGIYADISGIPSNVNELKDYFDKNNDLFSKLDPEVKEQVLAESVDLKKLDDYVKSKLNMNVGSDSGSSVDLGSNVDSKK